MSSVTVGLTAFACIFCGALFGLLIRVLVPHHHMSDDVKEVVKLGAGLIATLAALVLGLLVSSAKGTLDTMNSEITQDGAKIVVLDRALAHYGPETKAVRDLLYRSVAAGIKMVWTEERTGHARLRVFEAATGMDIVQDKLRHLSPGNDSQRLLRSQALQIAAELAQSRWLLIEQTQKTLPMAFLVVLLFWLTMLFACFGMLTPRNPTVITVLLICALSVSGAIFLIMEMNRPLEGVIKVSSAPLRKALENMGK